MRVGISKPLVALILAIASIIVIIVFISCQKDKKKEIILTDKEKWEIEQKNYNENYWQSEYNNYISDNISYLKMLKIGLEKNFIERKIYNEEVKKIYNTWIKEGIDYGFVNTDSVGININNSVLSNQNQNKIRIYNSTYNEIFPIPEGKEEELIARAKKYKMNYEIINE